MILVPDGDGRKATWSCSLTVALPSLAWVSARNMSQKSWSASTGTSTPWLGLVSIPLKPGTYWHKLAPAVQVQPVCIVGTLSSLFAQRRGLHGALIYPSIISRSPVSVRMSFESIYSTRTFKQPRRCLLFQPLLHDSRRFSVCRESNLHSHRLENGMKSSDRENDRQRHLVKGQTLGIFSFLTRMIVH